jgi:hypothetical protein
MRFSFVLITICVAAGMLAGLFALPFLALLGTVFLLPESAIGLVLVGWATLLGSLAGIGASVAIARGWDESAAGWRSASVISLIVVMACVAGYWLIERWLGRAVPIGYESLLPGSGALAGVVSGLMTIGVARFSRSTPGYSL